MKEMTRFLIVLALIGLSTGKANAQTNGMCGDSLTWSLTGTEPELTLTISGTGSMYDYRNNVPWRSKRNKINTLVLNNGMTSIGNLAFIQCERITSVTIPNSVKTIGKDAFSFCSGLTLITIPNSVTEIKSGAFFGCQDITDIYVSWTTSPPFIKKELLFFLPENKLKSNKETKKINLHILKGTSDIYQHKAWRSFNIMEDTTDTE